MALNTTCLNLQGFTTAQLNIMLSTCGAGTLAYNKTINKLVFHNGTAWETITSI